jgi:hypothetical protein
MKSTLFILLSIIIITCVASHKTMAQTQGNGHLCTMTMLYIPENEMDEFLSFFEKEIKPFNAENEYILSAKVYTHSWGPQWTVCLVTEYKDWEGFVAAEKKGNELLEKMYPDKSKRDELMKKFGSYLFNHTDAIVNDHPNLAK